MAEINVVPYIDVMLVLLVIFMITAPLLTQGVKVELPTAAAKTIEAKPPEPLVVSIDAQGNYYLNVAENPSQIINAESLLVKVQGLLANDSPTNKRQILIKGDKRVEYEKVVSAMVLLQRAGADSVGLMTQPE
jgi:biopolymer transport protein TolR